ncbi:MAG: DUF429 domain-containing protein, partial [Thioalkalivibrio sp.]|nr:DUF429 domain-containing protein [Thioalkalivibrio sp.]
TAHSALHLIDALRKTTGMPLPLLWEAGPVEGWGIIEVYPAASLASRSRLLKGYTKTEESRSGCLSSLSGEVELEVQSSEVWQSPHRLDAVIAVLAAGDFVAGRCDPPVDGSLAKREGWIWFRAGR